MPADLLSSLTMWAVTEGAKSGVSRLLTPDRQSQIRRLLLDATESWAGDLPAELGQIHGNSMFPKDTGTEGKAAAAVLAKVQAGRIPDEHELLQMLVEHRSARAEVEPSNLVEFFYFEDRVVEPHLKALARKIREVYLRVPELVQSSIHESVKRLEDSSALCREVREALEMVDHGNCARGAALLEQKKNRVDELPLGLRFELWKGAAKAAGLLCSDNDAADSYRRAAAVAQTDAQRCLCETWALVYNNKLSDAREHVALALKDNAGDPDLWRVAVSVRAENTSFDVLEDEVPKALRDHPRVAPALSKAAWYDHSYEAAAKYAAAAIRSGDRSAALYLARGDALLMPHAQADGRPPTVVVDEENRGHLEQAILYYKEGLEIARRLPSEEFFLGLLVVQQADAMVLLGRPEKEIGDLINSALLDLPGAVQVRVADAVRTARAGAPVHALDKLGDLALDQVDPSVWVEMAYHVRNRQDVAAYARAASLANFALEPGKWKVSRGVRAGALRVAVELLSELGKRDDARSLVERYREDYRPSSDLAAAWVAHEAGDTAAEMDALERAVQADLSLALHGECYDLARSLAEKQRFGDARTALGAMRDSERTEKSERLRVIVEANAGDLSTARRLGWAYLKEHGLDKAVVHLVLNISEADDPDGAVKLIERYLSEVADDSLMRLRKGVLGLRFARTEWLENKLSSLPEPEQIGPFNGRLAVAVLSAAGNTNDAVEYAFRLLRAHFEDGDARQAYLDAFFNEFAEPVIEDYSEVRPGTAVTLAMDGGASQVFVLEDGPSPAAARNEISSDGELAQSLIGHEVGDTVELPGLPSWVGQKRRISNIESKFSYWIRELLDPAVPQAGSRGIFAFPVPDSKEERLAQLRNMVGAKAASMQTLCRHYREKELFPVHLLADRLGQSAFETTMQLLADDSEVLKSASGGAGDATARVVVDQTVLAVVKLFQLEDVLARVLPHAVVGPETAATVRRFSQSRRLTQGHLDIRLEGIDGLYAVEYTAEDLSGVREEVERFAVWMEQTCRVTPATSIEKLPARTKEIAFKALGRGGGESLGIAIAEGVVLATDDFGQGVLAASLGGSFLSSADILDLAKDAGVVTLDHYLALKARLVGAGYLGAVIEREELMSLCRRSAWNTDGPPVSSLLSALGNRNVPVKRRLSLGRDLILAAVEEPGDSLLRNALVDRVLRSTRVLGLADNSLEVLVTSVRESTSAAGRRHFDSILSTAQVADRGLIGV